MFERSTEGTEVITSVAMSVGVILSGVVITSVAKVVGSKASAKVEDLGEEGADFILFLGTTKDLEGGGGEPIIIGLSFISPSESKSNCTLVLLLTGLLFIGLFFY
jgi:hypothetical protein